MYTGSGQSPRSGESAVHEKKERRLPTPVNHLNTLRPPPPAPPSSWALPPTIFRSEATSTSGPRPVPAAQTHSKPQVSVPTASWSFLSKDGTHSRGSSGMMPVSAAHHTLPDFSNPSCSWHTGIPYPQAFDGSAPQLSLGAHTHTCQPWTPGFSVSWAVSTEGTRPCDSSGPVSQTAYDYHHHTIPQPNFASQTPRAIKRRMRKSSVTATAPESQPPLTGFFYMSHSAPSIQYEGSDGQSPACLDQVSYDRMAYDRPVSRARSSSPDMQLNIIMEDPKSGQLYREKRIRSREELDSQKEGMRILKDNGGACAACYKSKKRCGPGDPCPPCSARGRECIRLNRYDGEIVSTGGPPASAPIQPVFISSQSVSTSPKSASSPIQSVSEPACPLLSTLRSESLTLVQSPLLDGPNLPESRSMNPASNEEDPAPLESDLLEDYFDPFCSDPWEAGMLCIDSAYDNPSHQWVGTDSGSHLAT